MLYEGLENRLGLRQSTHFNKKSGCRKTGVNKHTDSKESFEFKGVIPAIVGREVAEHFSQTTIFKIEANQREISATPITNLMPGRFNNWKDSIRSWFKRLSDTTKLEDGSEVFRMMNLPLKIEEACLKCHGPGATSTATHIFRNIE